MANLPAAVRAVLAPAITPFNGPNACSNDGGAGNSNNFFFDGNGNGIGAGIGTAIGIGTKTGFDFKLFKTVAALINLAAFNALAALIPAIFNAMVFLTTRNGAVMALNAANLVALACMETILMEMRQVFPVFGFALVIV